MKKSKTLSTKPIYNGYIISVSIDEIEMPNGAVLQRDVVRHPGAVVILPVDQNGNIYLIKQFRYAIDREILELPAGCLEKNEEPQACAERELQEEIGMAASTWQKLASIYPAPGFCDEVQHVFLAKDLKVSQLPMDVDEVIEVVKVPKDQLSELITQNKICDAKTLAVLYLAKELSLF